MPLNAINEKLFVIIWFWLFTLAIITIVSFLCDIYVHFNIQARKKIIFEKIGLVSKRYKGVINVQLIVEKMDFGDFKIIYSLTQALSPIEFCQVLAHMSKLFSTQNESLTESNDEFTNIQVDSNKSD